MVSIGRKGRKTKGTKRGMGRMGPMGANEGQVNEGKEQGSTGTGVAQFRWSETYEPQLSCSQTKPVAFAQGTAERPNLGGGGGCFAGDLRGRRSDDEPVSTGRVVPSDRSATKPVTGPIRAGHGVRAGQHDHVDMGGGGVEFCGRKFE
jgi:hypothetical protein